MNRDDFQRLAEARLEDAKTLLNAGRFGAAYYLAGYAVECALKACICRNTRQFDFPPRNANRYYDHNLQSLAGLADVSGSLDQECAHDQQFAAYWGVVKDWDEESRYEDVASDVEASARSLVQAISDGQHGVLRWLSKYW